MATTSTSTNRTIAKNTLFLYFRMLFTMCIGIYMSRVVLQALGASDFGVYSVVGGFVTMLTFLNSAFVSATQRFMSFSIGKQEKTELHRLFCTSVMTLFFIALLIVIVAETFGVWFINNQLVIPPDRLTNAHYVFQLSLLTMVMTIISVPYNSAIVAHEHMHVYAYISIMEACMKLGVTFLIVRSPFDRLVTYAFLLMIVSVIVRLCYTIYCKHHFEECKFSVIFDKTKFKEMTTYAFWVTIGSLGFSFKDQFSNIILNSFFGTTINAARGLAAHASAMLSTFASNFFMAITPQITKQYATGNIEACKKLVFAGAKFTFFLFSFLVIPVYINADYLLALWLGEVPEYTCDFLKITLLSTLIGTISQSTTAGIQATGKMKIFQIGISIIMLAELPIAYIILKMGYPPHFALMPAFATQMMGIIFRYAVLRHYVKEFCMRQYLVGIVLRAYIVFAVAFLPSLWLLHQLTGTFTLMLLSSTISTIILFCAIYILGLSHAEKELIHNKVHTLFKE